MMPMNPGARIFCTLAGLVVITVRYDAIRDRLSPHGPTVHATDIADVVGNHPLDGLQCPSGSGDLDAQAIVHRFLVRVGPHRHLVHVDQVLTQRVDIDFDQSVQGSTCNMPTIS